MTIFSFCLTGITPTQKHLHRIGLTALTNTHTHMNQPNEANKILLAFFYFIAKWHVYSFFFGLCFFSYNFLLFSGCILSNKSWI